MIVSVSSVKIEAKAGDHVRSHQAVVGLLHARDQIQIFGQWSWVDWSAWTIEVPKIGALLGQKIRQPLRLLELGNEISWSFPPKST